MYARQAPDIQDLLETIDNLLPGESPTDFKKVSPCFLGDVRAALVQLQTQSKELEEFRRVGGTPHEVEDACAELRKCASALLEATETIAEQKAAILSGKLVEIPFMGIKEVWMPTADGQLIRGQIVGLKVEEPGQCQPQAKAFPIIRVNGFAGRMVMDWEVTAYPTKEAAMARLSGVNPMQTYLYSNGVPVTVCRCGYACLRTQEELQDCDICQKCQIITNG